jgi:DNA-binding transcriptional LysR family regulator
MRLTQLRQADLNLLVVFAILAEERNVSRAAKRLFLSQPAVSRALQRLRGTFHDDLLVRDAKGYEPTRQGERLLKELEVMLPRLDRLIAGSIFDPVTEAASFRIACTDNATSIIAPILCRDVLPAAKQVRFEFIPWREGDFDELAHGRIDLVLMPDEVQPPPQLQSESIFYEDKFVCVVSKETQYNRQLTLKQYLAAEHIGVGDIDGTQDVPEKRLAVLGLSCRVVLHVPYFSAAIHCVAGTDLIATIPRRFAGLEAHNTAIKVLEAPAELPGFRYRMIWHPRVSMDAAHTWLRSTISNATKPKQK